MNRSKKDTTSTAGPRNRSNAGGSAHACGLCGNTKRLTKAECCGNWICDDEGDYVVFSYARNSCYRNHTRYTLCGSHHAEEHKGRWTMCGECRGNFETEMYVWYATNDYNFEKLADPPAYEPTHCIDCKRVIRLGEDGYMQGSDGYRCEPCEAIQFKRDMEARSSTVEGTSRKRVTRSPRKKRPGG